jgi:tRNA (uracil-5-)-methyltransferase TRM9
MRISATKSSILSTYEEMAKRVEEIRQTPWADVLFFERSLEHDRSVLEVGCGSGRNVLYFASMGHRVVAVDISTGMLGLAVRRIKETGFTSSVQFIKADAASLPLRDRSFDACVYVAALHHLPSRQDRLKSLEQVSRCLRNGGRALISVWAFEQERFKEKMEDQAGRNEGFGDVMVPITSKNGNVIERFYHLFIEGELEELVEGCGLGIERHFKSHDNYFVVAVRR